MLKSCRIFSVVLTAVFTLFILLSTQVTVFAVSAYYVDGTNGNDNNNGTSLATPFKTIQKAAQTAQAGDTIYIRTGVYRETVTPTNSNLTISAYNNESVTISGLNTVSEWTLDSGNIYYASVSMNLGTKNQVFVNSSMMLEARWPNSTGSDPLFQPTLAVCDSGTTDTSIYDADMQNIDWTGALLWYSPKANHGWSCWTSTVTSYSNRTITFIPNVINAWKPECNVVVGGQYFLTGKRAALDTAKEWFYDGSTQRIYIWVEGGGSPSSKTVEVKARENGFDLSNKSYITISGIDLFGCGVISNDSSHHNTINDMNAKYVYNDAYCVGSTDYISDRGISLRGGNNVFKNSTVEYSSHNGVFVSGSNNKVINNYITKCNYVGGYYSNINMMHSPETLISHNTLEKSGRSLVYGNFFSGEIQYNALKAPMIFTDDGGVIYSAGNQGNAEVHHNVISEVPSTGHIQTIYFDNNSYNAVVHHNLIKGDLGDVDIQFNIPGEYLLVYNNTVKGKIKMNYEIKNPGAAIGTRFFNNIATGGFDVSPSGISEVYMGNNCVDATPGFESSTDFRLASTSQCINAGVVESGITDGYVGTAPDIGCYEYSGSDWTAGHNFVSPPNPVYSAPTALHRNLVINTGADFGNLDNWTKTGTQNSTAFLLPSNRTDWDDNTAPTHTGSWSFRLGSGINGLEQTITGLSANTQYRLTAWVKVDSGEQAALGVKNYGSTQVNYTRGYTNSWVRLQVVFRTGSSNTSATICLNKTSSGSDYVYWDDVGLQNKQGESCMIYPDGGWWKCEGVAGDSSGNNNPETIYGASTIVGISANNAYSFDGVDDYLRISDADSLDMGASSNSFAVSAWIKTSMANTVFISKGRPNSGSSNIDYMFSLSNGKLKFERWHELPNSSVSVIDSDGTSINNNQWHHVVFVNESASSHKLYIDGTLVETSTSTWSDDDSNSEPLEIGRYVNYTYGTTYYNGAIDDVRVYKAPISAAQVMDIYKWPSGWWSFEKNSNDICGNGNMGISCGAVYGTGRKGAYSVNLDGVNDYISVNDANSLDMGLPSNKFTIAAWVKTTSAFAPILSKGRPNSGSSHIDYRLYLENGRLYFSRWHQSPDVAESFGDSDGSAINDGKWHHIAFVNESSTSHKLYIDGSLVETSTTALTYDDSNSEPLEIGRYANYVWGTSYYNGAVDDVRVYQAALSASDMSALAGN